MCQRCERRPARYHVNRTVNGEVVQEMDLCEQCATETGQLPEGGWDPHAALQLWLTGVLGVPQGAVTEKAQATAAAVSCPKCGTTYAQFARSGLLGCPDCYQAFQPQLSALIRRIHGASHHEGKTPVRTGTGIRKRHAMEELRRQLAEAIATEAFERAAELRDRIRAEESVGRAGEGSEGR